MLAERLAVLKSKKEANNDEKINLILFGSWEKIPTFALPTEREREKSQVADVMEAENEKIETDENTLRRIRLKRTAV